MPATKADLARMDQAAVDAQRELTQHLDAWSARDVSSWWSRWYLKAGHKRLGRILVGIAREAESAESAR